MLAILRRLTAERRSRIDQADALSQAYRGTAILLGSAIDADDGYTGQHSRGVVDLVRAVAEELGLPGDEVQRAEFTALLHDIGKIHVPKAILHKPGPLTPAEWEIVKRHPDDGARMLREVGGYLADIGALVRHHHERWDGGGYPDGLAGERDPARLAHRLRLRRVLGDDHRPLLPAGADDRVRAGGAARRRGQPVRSRRRRKRSAACSRARSCSGSRAEAARSTCRWPAEPSRPSSLAGTADDGGPT